MLQVHARHGKTPTAAVPRHEAVVTDVFGLDRNAQPDDSPENGSARKGNLNAALLVSQQPVLQHRAVVNANHYRALKDGGGVAEGGPEASSNVTVVKTAQALQDAVMNGAEHIEVQAHLDLTTLKFADCCDLLGKVNQTVKSIRVRHLMLILSRVLFSISFSLCHSQIIAPEIQNC